MTKNIKEESRYISTNELNDIKACLREENKTYDLQLIKVLSETGIRVGEVFTYLFQMCKEANQTKIDLTPLKKNKKRILPVVRDIEEIISSFNKELNDPKNRKNQKTFEKRFTDRIKKRVQRWNLNVSPHDFRATFITNALYKGLKMEQVSKLAGHKNITTTMQYDKRNTELDIWMYEFIKQDQRYYTPLDEKVDLVQRIKWLEKENAQLKSKNDSLQKEINNG